ncbi:hypothetical protein CDL15_Pgr024554 [Punica granatum]|uniref:BAR domain-containing protein n=1 Tax=Punica granatum TaxID=22663 RepID=A0A218XYT9_PUNGR|nr:hypothetical protein CDL15_Pgr024554 [Punica granatum]
MKTSLRKLGRFTLHRHVDPTQRRYLRSLSQSDELAQASQDLDDMRDCYDSLLSAAAATTNTAYEFSESLRELGSCLLEKTALNDDEESGKVLLMLGKMQFELQKLLDRYRSHISRTITIPSQSLLNELRTVEEMKRQCDEKRSVYEYIVMNRREKGKSRTVKGENFSMQQLQDAREQYDEEATLFVFRLKSLKQGQSRSLLTQAARHHAAQLDPADLTFPHVATTETVKENLERNPREFIAFSGDFKAYTQSAPLFAEKKSLDLADRMPPMRQSSIRKLQTYVLPTPGDPKSSASTKPVETFASTPKANLNAHNQMVWHSSPLDPPKYGKKSADEKYSGTPVSNTFRILKESNKKSAPNMLPSPLAEGSLFLQFDPITASSSKKFKRQAYSGPLTKKPEPSQPLPEHPQLYSGPILRNPMSQPLSSSPKASLISSSPLTSSPKISELHELPRPPASSTGISSRPPGLVGYSAPLVSRGPQDSSVKSENVVAGAASPLPRPPSIISRSFSIPTSGSKPKISGVLQDTQNGESPDAGSSPPLTPISLPNSRP